MGAPDGGPQRRPANDPRQGQDQRTITRSSAEGIRGRQAYLLDVILLVEMLWADGRCQDAERVLNAKCLREHADWLRNQAGVEVVTGTDVDAFIARFVDQPPPEGLLKTLREFVHQTGICSSGPSAPLERRQQIIDYCIDIAAAAVATYPYGPHERFEKREKQVLRELLAALDLWRHTALTRVPPAQKGKPAPCTRTPRKS